MKIRFQKLFVMKLYLYKKPYNQIEDDTSITKMIKLVSYAMNVLMVSPIIDIYLIGIDSFELLSNGVLATTLN